jgi:GT2 family glycosyltransferase
MIWVQPAAAGREALPTRGRLVTTLDLLRPARLTLVVATWNHWSVTERFIESFRNGTRHYWNLIFVDNGSTDATADRIVQTARTADLNVTLLTNARNEGCSRAWNRGIRTALEVQSPLLGVFNNDLVLAEGWDEGIVEFWRCQRDRHPVHVMTGSLDWFRRESAALMRRNHGKTIGRMRSDALLIDASLFPRVGLYDEDFFVSYEDLDFYLRLRDQGIAPVTIGGSVVWHHEQSSRRDLPHSHEVEGRAIFLEKWPHGLDDAAFQKPARTKRTRDWLRRRLGRL